MEYIRLRVSIANASPPPEPMNTGFPAPRRLPLSPKGFALIATVSVLILLALIAVALLSLSSVRMRSADSALALAEAKANARMALVLALSELQEAAGPDQRITARAAVLDKDPATEAMDGFGQSGFSPLVLGSWDSWQTWLNARMKNPSGGRAIKIQDTYTAGRGKLFRRWLISHAEKAVTGKADAPLGSAPVFKADNSVVLLGKGSLGEGQAGLHVRAGLVGAGDGGRYAWWIGGENQKGSLNLAKQEITAGQGNNLNDDLNDILMAEGEAPRHAPEVLPGLESLDSADAPKWITPGTVALSLGTTPAAAETIRKYSDDLTGFSYSLLTDARFGGTKKDLSLLFEKRHNQENDPAVTGRKPVTALPEGYRQTADWEPPVRPYTTDLSGQNPSVRNRTFFSWEKMYEFYRIHRVRRGNPADQRKIWSTNPQVKEGVLDGEARGVHLGAHMTDKPVLQGWAAEQFGYNDSGYPTHPVLLKMYAFIGTHVDRKYKDGKWYCICSLRALPVAVFWNPYNVPVSFKQRMMMSAKYDLPGVLKCTVEGMYDEPKPVLQADGKTTEQQRDPFRGAGNLPAGVRHHGAAVPALPGHLSEPRGDCVLLSLLQ